MRNSDSPVTENLRSLLNCRCKKSSRVARFSDTLWKFFSVFSCVIRSHFHSVEYQTLFFHTKLHQSAPNQTCLENHDRCEASRFHGQVRVAPSIQVEADVFKYIFLEFIGSEAFQMKMTKLLSDDTLLSSFLPFPSISFTFA